MKVSGMHEHGDHGVSVHLRQVVAQDDSVPRVDNLTIVYGSEEARTGLAAQVGAVVTVDIVGLD